MSGLLRRSGSWELDKVCFPASLQMHEKQPCSRSACSALSICLPLFSWKKTRKDPEAGKDRRQEKKGITEDEVVGCHQWFNGHEFEQAPGDGEGQGSVVCCSLWSLKESDKTERLNSNSSPVRKLSVFSFTLSCWRYFIYIYKQNRCYLLTDATYHSSPQLNYGDQWGVHDDIRRIHISLNLLWVERSFSQVWLFATLWSVAHLAPLSIRLSRQEHWNELSSPLPESFLTQRSSCSSPLCLLQWQAGSPPLPPPGKPLNY